MTGAEASTLQPQEMPGSAWLLGSACLAGQVVTLVDRGLTESDAALISASLSALVVAWVSYGVLRARTVRTWLAGILLALMALLGLVDLLTDASLSDLVGAAASVTALAALVAYTRTDVFAVLREHPNRPAPPLGGLGGLVALAIVVGALGGLTAVPDARQGQSGFHVRVGL